MYQNMQTDEVPCNQREKYMELWSLYVVNQRFQETTFFFVTEDANGRGSMQFERKNMKL